MKYEAKDDKDFLVFEGRSVEIERLFISDPADAGSVLADEIVNRLISREPCLIVVGVGDSTKLTLVGYPPNADNFSVQLGEVRNDGHGMVVDDPIPGAPGNAVLPMVQVTGDEREAETVMFAPHVPFGYVAKIVFDSVCIALNERVVEQSS